MPYDEDVWELYDMRTDFGQANDLAAEHPDKLAELQALFDGEARKYNVYPLADNPMALLNADRPKLVHGDKATYGPGTIRLSEDAVINIKNRSFSLIAEVDNPDGDAEGTLVTLGGETGGYALLVVDGKPTFHYNFLGLQRYTITATEPIPTGPCTIRFDFAYDGGGPGKGGTGTLTVNGKPVGEGRIDKTVPGLLLHRRHLRRRRGLGNTRLTDLPATVRVHRNPEEGHGARQVALSANVAASRPQPSRRAPLASGRGDLGPYLDLSRATSVQVRRGWGSRTRVHGSGRQAKATRSERRRWADKRR